jgi:hypothetical protein
LNIYITFATVEGKIWEMCKRRILSSKLMDRGEPTFEEVFLKAEP